MQHIYSQILVKMIISHEITTHYTDFQTSEWTHSELIQQEFQNHLRTCQLVCLSKPRSSALTQHFANFPQQTQRKPLLRASSQALHLLLVLLHCPVCWQLLQRTEGASHVSGSVPSGDWLKWCKGAAEKGQEHGSGVFFATLLFNIICILWFCF